MSAYRELLNHLEEGEIVESIIFGEWGWFGYGEPIPPPVPNGMMGKPLSLDEARPLMQGWKIYGGYGAPECYAIRVWTNTRILWVTQYDGATGIDDSPRNPLDDYIPDMPGG